MYDVCIYYVSYYVVCIFYSYVCVMYRIDYLDTLPLYKYKYVGSFYDKSILYVVAIPYREGVHIEG